MEFHPLAKMFPMMEGVPFADLVADISEHGVREPIILLDGKILDGRNRFRASKAAGVPCPHRVFNGEGDPLAFVVSLNLKRRHLNEGQRGMVAAKIATLKRGYIASQRSDGAIAPSQTEAATLLNVSRETVKRARIVINEGTPEEIAAVEAGEASVSTIARDIRAKVPVSKRIAKRNGKLSDAGKNPERIENQRVNAEVWKRLRGALDDLTSLPLPADVAELVSAQVKRTDLVNAKLPSALKWIEDFSNAWTSK